MVSVEDTYRGKQQKAVLLSEVFESQSEAWAAAAAYLDANDRHEVRLGGLHVVRVSLESRDNVPRRSSPNRVTGKPTLLMHPS